MNSLKKEFKATGLTARLFNAIEELSEAQKQELLVLIGDKRTYKRTPCLMEIDYKTCDASYSDFILDISPGGTFIKTNENFFIGQKLDLSFNFKGEKEALEIEGSVAWQNKGGVGIKFIFHTSGQQKRLIDIVSKL